MVSRRTEKIMVHLEPQIFVAVQHVMFKEKLSGSAYARAAIIEDLKRRGMLTVEMIAELAV